ncbi:MAG: hypothetical protein ABR548_10970 [Actinomycetota bacterium]|nr:hypothetical protein [Actinomycetota bacterium]
MTAPADDARPASRRRFRTRERTRTRAAGSSRVGEILRREQRLVSAIILLAAGIAFILLGWYGAANTNILTEQIPYLISGGLLGLGLIIVSGIMASSAGLERDNRALRDEIVRALAATGRTVTAGNTTSTGSEVFSVPGGHSYHVAGCPILEGKEGVQPVTRADASGLAACKLCGPD